MKDGKWKKLLATTLGVGMAAALSLGIFTACTDTSKDDEDEDAPAAKTDTQLIKNGDFELYSESTKEKDDLRAILNTPTSWSFTSGSPSSDTRSGLINVGDDYWDYFTKEGYHFTSVSDAYANWKDERVTVYDRLKFLDEFDDEIDDLSSSSNEKKLFNEYNYSVDYEDVQYLREELDGKILLHDDAKQREDKETGILMIHNRRTSDNVLGTAQSYSSSTTVTLQAGTAAKVSVWVKTARLEHYYAATGEDKKEPVERRAGAYIGVTHTVGGTTMDQMQIKNINTAQTNPDNTDNGWEQYTVYLRANTYATSSFRIVLGLGMGSSDNRYEAVNGYAFFDDLKCEIISNEDYANAQSDVECDYDNAANDKKFDATENPTQRTFKLDMFAPLDGSEDLFFKNFNETDDVYLTKETSGSKTYNSSNIDAGLSDDRTAGANIATQTTLAELKGRADGNKYLAEILKSDFGNYAYGDSKLVFLLSSNGAAYTARLADIQLAAGERLLLSFWVKTSKIMTGRTGAGATLVDGENKTAISPFDTTTLAGVDIDDERTDINHGWTQCFFFVSNDTDTDKTFHLELTYGPTTIVGTDRYDYGQGYAAFANFDAKKLTKTELSYASTGDRAVSVSLTGRVADTTEFDTVSAASDIKSGLALPANFTGIVAGSKNIVSDGVDNYVPENVYTGLLNSQYAKDYLENENNAAWIDRLGAPAPATVTEDSAKEWWNSVFGDTKVAGAAARQPLVIANVGDAAPAYGYFAKTATVSANSYQKISMRVKLSQNAKAYIYLTDASDVTKGYDRTLSADAPKVTYWYDDDGNICSKDPSEKDSEILYYLADNGLYTNAKENDGKYYANLHNYTEENGNLVTKEGTTAFYGHEGKYYAYYDEDKNEHSQVVENLPANIARYNYTNKDFTQGAFTSVIEIDGAGNEGRWIDVAFYVHTGNEAKTYRLEVFAGSRYNDETGLPANSYAFFDRYVSESTSNYDAVLSEAVTNLKEKNNVAPDENLGEDVALYYTFTFYDSASYTRYDATLDEDELGNPYGSYKQSSHEEQLIALKYSDGGDLTGAPVSALFLDYAATEVTVEQDDLGNNNDDDSDDEDSKEPLSTGDILLIVSSSLLGVVLIFAIVAIVVRRVLAKRKKSVKVRSRGAARARKTSQVTKDDEDPSDEK